MCFRTMSAWAELEPADLDEYLFNWSMIDHNFYLDFRVTIYFTSFEQEYTFKLLFMTVKTYPHI